MADNEQGSNNTPDPAQAFNALIAKNNNDALSVASKLFDENFQYREQIRTLKAQQPKEGSIVLDADDAKLFNAYKDLGVSPKDLKPLIELGKPVDEIKAALDKVPELEQANKELRQMDDYREIAAVHGYKVPVLKKLMAEHPDAVFEFRTEKDAKDPKIERKAAYIRTGDDKEQPFTEFAEQNFADFLPALKADADTNQHQQQTRVGNTPDPQPAKGSDPTPADNAARTAQARAFASRF